jgi:hypothetical protein
LTSGAQRFAASNYCRDDNSLVPVKPLLGCGNTSVPIAACPSGFVIYLRTVQAPPLRTKITLYRVFRLPEAAESP